MSGTPEAIAETPLLSTTTFDEKSEAVDTCTWYELTNQPAGLFHINESVRETPLAPSAGVNSVGAGISHVWNESVGDHALKP